MKKLFTIFLICILFSSLFVVCSGFVFAGSSISKPSVPEFTLQFVDNSYDVPPTFQKDPFTGETVLTQEGYHVDNRSIEVKIKNQPSFNVYEDSQGNVVGLAFDIRWKGHFDDNWHEYGSSDSEYIYLWGTRQMIEHDSLMHPYAPHTVVIYAEGINYYDSRLSLGDIADGGQIDFQVKALIGYLTVVEEPGYLYFGSYERYVFTGESSGWSKTQTVTIGADKGGVHDHSPSDQTPFSSTNQSESSHNFSTTGFSLMECVLLVVVVVLVVLLGVSLFYIRKRMVLKFHEDFS